MRRWLPYVLTVIGLAGLIAGWRLYPDTCDPQQLYREVVEGYPPCEQGRDELVTSLSFLTAGAAVFLGGWAWAGIHAKKLAALLLVGLMLITGAGWFGWQKYDEHRDAQRLRQAERDLAALVLPADWVPVTALERCFVDAQNRCHHSSKSPQELKAALIALLHGREEGPFCPPPRARFPCSVIVRGTVNGYLAVGFANPDVYFPHSRKPPPGAQQILRGKLPTIYVDGTLITIALVPDPSVLAIPEN